ncbi:hypothetical protein [Sphingomonas sp.]|uniref:hypothetical protein n=1 Tax=Sphingomonas sp. TaxID=28214 RepID=UPI003CC5E393
MRAVAGFAIFASAATAATAQQAPPALSSATGSDVTVVANVAARSPWKRAETAHVVVTGKLGDAELAKVAIDLERLYGLLTRLYRHGDPHDETAKLQVTLIESRDRFHALGLDAGGDSYAAPFAGGYYYAPGDDGDVLAVVQADRDISTNTRRAASLTCDDVAQGGGAAEDAMQGGVSCSHLTPNLPVRRAWRGELYGAFAEHFILTHVPAVYPRWYLDGIAALFSTVQVRGDGAVDYARPPMRYGDIVRAYGDVDVAAVLSGRYLDPPAQSGGAPRGGAAVWTPYHAWLLAHYFLFSPLPAARSRQFAQYMAAVHDGAPLAQAATAFTDPGRLQRELNDYPARTLSYARTATPGAAIDPPLVTALSPAAGAAVEMRLAMPARLAGPAAAQADWLAAVRATTATPPYDAEAMLFAAEAACRGGRYDDCLAAAERVLTATPTDARAMGWQAEALTGQAIAGAAADRAAMLARARAVAQRATELDQGTPLAALAWVWSYTAAGERAPPAALAALAHAVRSVPAAPGPRLALAAELIRQGRPDLGRRLLQVVALGPYDTADRRTAQALLAGAAPTS